MIKYTHDTYMSRNINIHLQMYSFFNIYSILLFMGSKCKGGKVCIYLVITGRKILVFIHPVIDTIGSFLLWNLLHFCFCFNNH